MNFEIFRILERVTREGFGDNFFRDVNLFLEKFTSRMVLRLNFVD